MKLFPWCSLSTLALVLWLCPICKSSAEIIAPDRLVSWKANTGSGTDTIVGVPGGIPNRTTIGKNAVTDYGADPTGAKDSHAAIQSAIDNTPSGQVAYIPAGTYKIVGKITSVSNKTIRGAGLGATILKFEGETGNGSVFTGGGSPFPTDPTISITSGATNDSSSVVVNTTSGLSVGNLITISSVNQTWIHFDSALYGSGPGDDGHDSTRLLNTTHYVTSISGTTVHFTPALPITMGPTPKITVFPVIASGVGIEDLTFDCVNSAVAAPMWFSSVYGCWVKNVEVNNSHSRILWGRAMVNCEIRHCYAHDTNGTGPNHEGIDLVENCCFNLIEDNISIAGGKPGIILGDWGGGCSGNVIAYNYIKASTTHSGPMEPSISINHGPHNVMNLIEGNVGQALQSDGYYGSTSHVTILRNLFTGDFTPAVFDWPYCLKFSKWSYYCNAVGNVLGKSGLGQTYSTTAPSYPTTTNVIWQIGYPNVGNTGYGGTYNGTPAVPGLTNTNDFDNAVLGSLIRHGNYDYATKSIIYDSGIPDHAIPNSYFRSAAPSFFGNLTWPPVNPLSPDSAKPESIPAGYRYINGRDPGGTPTPTPTPPQAPSNLRIQGN